MYRFEEDPEQEVFSVVCQSDGFFKVPKEDSWPKCVQGPSCDIPPNIPFEGSRLVIPKVVDTEFSQSCAVDGNSVVLKCPSFQTIYVKSALYGRKMR